MCEYLVCQGGCHTIARFGCGKELLQKKCLKSQLYNDCTQNICPIIYIYMCNYYRADFRVSSIMIAHSIIIAHSKNLKSQLYNNLIAHSEYINSKLIAFENVYLLKAGCYRFVSPVFFLLG